MFDLATLDTIATAEQGAKLELRHPATDEPLGAVLVLAGADSKTYRRHEAATLNRFLDRMAKGKRGKGKSAEEQEREGVEMLVACTLNWSGVVLDGTELPCTPENALMLYTRMPWVKEQAREFIMDRWNYLRD